MSVLSPLIYLAIAACTIPGATCAWSNSSQDFGLATVGVPLPCHSHNDYLRTQPLFNALEAGCTSVEADVWLYNKDLYISHETPQTLEIPTFTELYVNPIFNILKENNIDLAEDNTPVGVFSKFPNQELVLLVDFKEDNQAVFDTVSAQLQPLRERGWLTYFKDGSLTKGPITVVATGEARLSTITANPTYRDIFLDAPTLELKDDTERKYDSTNSYYTSVSFGQAFGHVEGCMDGACINELANYVRQAHEHGLKLRFWGQPAWPVSMQEWLWGILLDAGVDYLNVDDLVGANRWLAKHRDEE